jgi:hypothetical protein
MSVEPLPGADHGSSAAPDAAGGPRGDVRRAVGIAVMLTVVLAGMLSLFAWPAARLAPHDLPVVVAGPAPATQAITAALAQARPGGFVVTSVTTRDEAVRSVTEQNAYAGVVVTATGAEVLTASARSLVVAQLFSQAATQLATAQGITPTVTDLVPAPADDPRGAGLVAGLLPIILGGLACAALATAAIRKRVWRVGAAVGFSVLGGVVLTVLLQGWLGSLSGSFLANAGVLSLGIASVAIGVLGLEAVFGMPGLGLGALVMMLFGNALSGAASAPELLPAGWGTVGQWLPAGATNTALRSVAFFGGHGASGSLLVLAGWVTLGLVLVAAGGRRRSA